MINSSPLIRRKLAFHKGRCNKIYLRSEEISEIKHFLNSDKEILHICGNPGTGKTCITLNIIKQKKHIYINCFESMEDIKNIFYSKIKIIILDEFDQLYNKKRNLALQIFEYIKNNKKKLITICNNLNIHENILFFKPYSFEQILFIVKEKIHHEIGHKIAEDYVLAVIAKKFSGSGDIRSVFEYIKNLIDKKNTNTEIEIDDLFENKENVENSENLHHKLIKNIANSGKGKRKLDSYEIYLVKCKENGIPHLGRNDYIVIYEIYKQN